MSDKNTPEKKMPRAPLKLACIEDVARYMTTVIKMLHNDQIPPQKATALRGLCEAKIAALKQNKEVKSAILINIGCALGSGTKKQKQIKQKDQAIEINMGEELLELTTHIEEVLAND